MLTGISLHNIHSVEVSEPRNETSGAGNRKYQVLDITLIADDRHKFVITAFTADGKKFDIGPLPPIQKTLPDNA